jgi:hypothetical protein
MKRGVFIKSGSGLMCRRAGIPQGAGIISALKKARKDICRHEIMNAVFDKLQNALSSLLIIIGPRPALQIICNIKIKRNECL